MSTRSSQHRNQTQEKPPPNKVPRLSQTPSIKSEPSEAKSEPKSSDPKLSEADNEMKDEDEMLASPQASQGKKKFADQALMYVLFKRLKLPFLATI